MMLHEKIRENADFTDTECSIASFFLDHEQKLENLSARDIAKSLYISASAVTRFCQKLGYSGYPSFRKDFQAEAQYLNSHFSSIDANRPFARNTSDYETAARIGALYKETVDDTLSLLNYETLEKAARMLAKAGIIYVVSAGAHGYLAELFLGKMSRINKTVVYTPNSDIAYNYAAAAESDDCFIIISYSGETPETMKIARKLTSLKHPFIALTSYGKNSLSALSDCVLYISTREKMKSAIGSFSSTLSILYLLDTLYACVFRKDYDQNLIRKYKTASEFQNLRHSDNPLLDDEKL